MMRTMLAALGVLLLIGPASAEEKTKILLIGKDRDHALTTHEYMADCELLARCLRQTPGIETVVTNGWPKDAEVLKDVKAIVLHTQKGGNVLFNGPQRKQAEELLKQGVGLTAIHWSTGADPGEVGELWMKTLGGWFDHPAQSRYLVKMTKAHRADADHPVCRGWQDFDLRDEFYIQLRFMPEARPVITVAIEGQDYPLGWVYERPGGGRSFGFMGGHFHANFAETPFRQAIVNGILWTARRDVPMAGAPCAITPKDMELPPDTRKK